jgi:hypothetical protein
MRQIPNFKSMKAERKFWDTHDAIEFFGDTGWKKSEPGMTTVKSVYLTKVRARGAVIHVPTEWLVSIGAKKGQRIKAHVQGKRLVMELA